jgi:hypothetical protein
MSRSLLNFCRKLRPDCPFHPALVKAVEQFKQSPHIANSRSVKTSDLLPGMALASDLIANNGMILLTKGQTLTPLLLECLHRRVEYYGAAQEEVLVENPASGRD